VIGAVGPRVSGFWHVGITVADLDRSLRFYSDVLGLEVVSRAVSSSATAEVWGLPGAQADVVYLQVPGAMVMLELLRMRVDVEQRSVATRPWDPGAGHFCLLVEDLDGLYERLSRLGYRSRSGVVTRITDGTLAGSKVAYLVDPDGYHVEVFERLKP
jgi:catechol 2,3-dioxygenase-like lactoylglutathione lyase family enzyme